MPQESKRLSIHVISDLHLEFGEPWTADDARGHVVVAAGDLGKGIHGLRTVAEAAETRPVIAVAGNHEFYGEKYPSLLGKLCAEAERLNQNGHEVHFLERGVAYVAGVRFLGCTLWTDLELLGDPAGAAAAAGVGMNDYRYIRDSDDGYRPITPFRLRAVCLESKQWLFGELAKPHDGPTVVVTHHPPVPECTRSCHRRQDRLAPAFLNNWKREVIDCGADLWVCGHTHCCCDFHVGRTRVVCNQRGYPHESLGWDPEKVIDIAY